jgi:uncharacterized protein (DUF924 family)
MTDQNPTLPAAAARVLDVWFTPLNSPKYPEPKNALWSGKNPQTDADLTAEFSDLLDAAGRGEFAGSELEGELAQNVKFAIAHRDIVERFGRFPHRNEVWGHKTTAEEAEFLETPGSSF